MDTYRSLCAEYYELDKPSAPADELAFYAEFAREFSGSILEPMCGTGRFLLPLLEQGVNVEGYDGSSHMLELLQKKADAKGLDPTVWRQLTTDLPPTDKTYDLIMIPAGSIGLLTNDTDLEQSLHNLKRQLKPGGKLVFDIETPAVIEVATGEWNSSVVSKPEGGKIQLSTLEHSPQNHTRHITCKYELVENGDVKLEEVEEIWIRLFSPQEIRQLLHRAGFKDIVFHKAYTRGQTAGPDDEIVIVECSAA